MPTLNEVLHGIPQGFVVLGGSTGLGRHVARVLHVRPSDVVSGSIHQDDLVVYAAGHAHAAPGRTRDSTLSALLLAGPAGVLTDIEPDADDIQAAERCGSPLLASIGAIETQMLHTYLEQSLAAQQSLLDLQQAELHRSMGDVARAGATPTMLLERLVALTGKAGALHRASGESVQLIQPVLQELEPRVLTAAINSSAPAFERWQRSGAADLLYLELPVDRLVRIVAPARLDGTLHGSVSLFARSDELVGRDGLALVAAATAIAIAYASPPVDVAAAVGRRRCAAVVLRGADATPQDLASAAQRQFEQSRIALAIGLDDVRVCVPFEVADRADWAVRLRDWQARLSDEFGPVSIGHALRMGTQASDVRYALVQAAEAVRLGDRLFGPGHVTSYADAQLANFLLGKRDPYELRAFFELVVGNLATEDAKRERELGRTLETYCETFSTQRTAERLQVHRNTVLYRLRQIEEITSFDLEDGPTRLLLHLGLLAGNLVRKASTPRGAPRVARLRAGTNVDMDKILSA